MIGVFHLILGFLGFGDLRSSTGGFREVDGLGDIK